MSTSNEPFRGRVVPRATRAAVATLLSALVFAGCATSQDVRGSSGLGLTGDEAPQDDNASGAVQETAPVTVIGDDLAPHDDVSGTRSDPASGLSAPTLQGETFDGSEVRIDMADGRAKMVVFLAHWCPHCQYEVPVIQEWIDSGDAPEGLDIYSVATAQDQNRPNFPPSAWLSEEGWTPPVLLDDPDQSAARAFGLTGFPFFVLVDVDGTVWERPSGELSAAELDELVREMLVDGTPQADDA